MIKVGSKVIIKEFQNAVHEKMANDLPPLMIVEGLYYQAVSGMLNVKVTAEEVKPISAKCLWYNTKDELQSEYIRLELLQDL